MRKYVLTGGPCVGKTTTCLELQKLGYTIVPEAARMIIAEEKQKPDGSLPWTNFAEFQNKVFKRQLELESRVNSDIIFFDRGIIDIIPFCVSGSIPVPEELSKRPLYTLYEKVFLLEPLPYYMTDEERKEPEEKALRLQAMIEEAYKNYEYSPIHVPFMDPKERARYIRRFTI